MLETAQDIVKAVDERYGEGRTVRQRYDSDYGLWLLEEYQLGKKGEFQNYTSNEPRREANKVIDLLAYAPFQIEIPLQGGEKERENISNAERFCYGCINLANSRLQALNQPLIQEQEAFYSTLRGRFALRVYIRKDKKGDTIPDIVVWDAYNVAWDVGAGGLLWACHLRTATASQLKAEYDIDIKSKTAKVYDFWDEEKFAVVIKGETIKSYKHNLGYVPVLISTVGATPIIQSEKYQDTSKDTGESIYGAKRTTIEHRNKLMTYYMTIVNRGIHGSYAVVSEGGKKGLQTSPFIEKAEIKLDSAKGEKVEPIFQPVMPKDAADLYSLIDRESMAAGVSPALYGLPGYGASGYHQQLLTYAGSTILLPRQKAMESSLEWMCRELLTQYKSGFKQLRLHGRERTNEYFDVELSPADIKGDWFPEVRLNPILPEDTAAKLAMYTQAAESEIISRRTAREKVGIQDPDLEGQIIIVEKAERLPSILLRKTALAFIKEGREDLARPILEELAAMTAGARQTAPEPPYKEAVEPQFATGMSRSILPSEELGKVHEPPVTTA